MLRCAHPRLRALTPCVPALCTDSEQLYEDWFQRAIEADGIGAGAKVVRINVFPHVLLLGGLLCVTVLWRILGPYVRPLWFRISNGHWKTTFKRQRKYIAPYTAEFAKLLSDDGNSSSPQDDDAAVVASALKYAVSPKVSKDKGGDDGKDGGATTNAAGRLSARILSKLELSQGWRVQKRGDVLVLQKQWMDSRKVHGGKWHEYGQLKRTWEVIADADAVRCVSLRVRWSFGVLTDRCDTYSLPTTFSPTPSTG